MTILLPVISTVQTINYVPHYSTAVDSIIFTDEQENVEFSGTLVGETSLAYYNSVELTLDTTQLIEQRVYMVVFKDSSDNILFTDKVFSTAQPINTFSVNNGGYINPPTTTNQYIIYE